METPIIFSRVKTQSKAVTRIPKFVIAVVLATAILCISISLTWNLSSPAKTSISSINAPSQLSLELLKLAVQFVLIAIIGSLVSQEVTKRRERKNAVNTFRKRILSDVIKIYTGIKKCRRLLRAKCNNGAASDNNFAEIPYNEYDKQINKINDTQLKLEVLIHELTSYKSVFSKEDSVSVEVLIEQLENMESYLRKVIREYEKVLSMYDSIPDCIQLRTLPKLQTFIQNGSINSPSSFTKEFTSSFTNSLNFLRSEKLTA